MLHLVFRATSNALQVCKCRVGHGRGCSKHVHGAYSWRSRNRTDRTSLQPGRHLSEPVVVEFAHCWLLASDLLERVRRGAMGLRFVGSMVAPALCALVFLGLFLGQCSCQQIVVLGGDAGWTDITNTNYTLFMSTVQFKAGDTLRFNNTDIKDHDVYQLSTQSDYDACNSNNNTGWTVNAGYVYDLPFPDPAYRVWIIDTQYCTNGQKVEFTVLNADGTAVPPDTTADPPSLNAPQPDPQSPPAPPDAPLALAGGPSPNAASSLATVHWAVLAILAVACYLASPAF